MPSAPPAPVLVVGGSGFVGRLAAGMLRRFQPDLPLAIGARDLARASAVAQTLGDAQALQVDLQRRDLGLPHDARYGAMVVFVKDETLNTLRFAQDRGIAYVSVSSGSFEIAPEVAQFIQHPQAAPVLMLSHWLAGAASLPTLHALREFESVGSIEIGVMLDEQDVGGPAAHADLERLTRVAPHAQVLEQGRWVWAQGELSVRSFVGVDGTAWQGQAYSPLDVVSLAAPTTARRVRLDIAVGESAARRRGQHYSTEIAIEIEGVLRTGGQARVRHHIVHPQGQAPLTAVGVAVAVERLLGLDGGAPVPQGLYMPDVLIDPARMIRRMQDIGAVFSRS